MIATAKQISYINTLIAQRAEIFTNAGDTVAAQAVLDAAATIDMSDIDRNAIDNLKAGNAKLRKTIKPLTSTKPASDALTDGMYRIADGRIFKLQWNREKTHVYGKELITTTDADGTFAEFVYTPGILRLLTLADKMSLEEAKEYGALYGTCCVCARTLTNEASIEAGIGPVCATKF